MKVNNSGTSNVSEKLENATKKTKVEIKQLKNKQVENEKSENEHFKNQQLETVSTNNDSKEMKKELDKKFKNVFSEQKFETKNKLFKKKQAKSKKNLILNKKL